MRNLLRLGMEEDQVVEVEAEQQVEPLNIDPTEAAVMVNDAQAEVTTSDNNMRNMERMLQMSDGLEDLAVIAENIETATPVEAALINASAQMAVAGTDVDATEIVPAMEAHGRVGMEMAETLREKAKAIWDSVHGALAGVRESIAEWFRKNVGVVPLLRSHVDEIRGELDKYAKEKATPIKFTWSTDFFIVGDRKITNFKDLKEVVADELATLKWVAEDYAKGLLKVGEGIAKAYADYKQDDIEGFAKDLTAALRHEAKFPGHKESTARRPSSTTYVGAALFCGVSLVQHDMIARNKGDMAAELEAARTSTIVVEDTNLKTKVVPTEIRFDAFELSECYELLDMVTEIADIVEHFNRSAFPKELQEVTKRIDESIIKIITSYKETNEITEEQKALLKVAANVSVSFASMVKTPIQPIFKHAGDVGFQLTQMSHAGLEKIKGNLSAEADADEVEVEAE